MQYHKIEDPAASCRESSTVRNSIVFLIRSLTPQQAAGNALAVSVQTVWILLILWVFFSACGYRFAGGGNFPGGIRSMSISVFENHSAETGVENIITNDLIYEITRDGRVILTANAEASLTGVIASIRTDTITHSGTHTSLERRVVVAVDLQLKAPSGKVIWTAKDVSANEVYDVAADKQTTEQNRRNAIATLSKRLAETMYHRLTEDF
jgi:outer membrane lipopolysaccharide assembly protein LptE/RlpB